MPSWRNGVSIQDEKSAMILEETYLAMVVGAYSVESAKLSGSTAT